MVDQTLKDINRRELNFFGNDIRTVLPEYFAESNPNLIALFDEYYKNLDSDGNFGQIIKDLPKARDIGQTDITNLTYIEDELLLGQNYLEGILDTRTGAELSNNYYRSKGTKYGIQRFFRAFFGIDVDVVYGKTLLFNVGETEIGPNSGKFIMNDKVYQFWGLLIKASIPAAEWLELYKLFAHPSGMYLGAEVQIVMVNEDISFDFMPLSVPGEFSPTYEDVASSFDIMPSTSISGIIQDSAGEYIRIDLAKNIEGYTDITYNEGDSDQFGSLEYMQNTFDDLKDAIIVTSETMDEDSDGSAIGVANMSDDQITFDADEYTIYDSSS